MKRRYALLLIGIIGLIVLKVLTSIFDEPSSTQKPVTPVFQSPPPSALPVSPVTQVTPPASVQAVTPVQRARRTGDDENLAPQNAASEEPGYHNPLYDDPERDADPHAVQRRDDEEKSLHEIQHGTAN